MGFQDFYRMSSHAVITNDVGQVLLLKANYANYAWGLPGGGLDLGETIHAALIRECCEELGCDIQIEYLSGVYYHAAVNSHAFIFKCKFDASKGQAEIKLSSEHSEYAWFDIQDLSEIQQLRVNDCIHFNGSVLSRAF